MNNISSRRSKKTSCLVRERTIHSTRSGTLVDEPKSIQSCVSIPVQNVDKYEDEDQTRTGRPVGGKQSTQQKEVDIDFRVPGFSHAVCERSRKFPP